MSTGSFLVRQSLLTRDNRFACYAFTSTGAQEPSAYDALFAPENFPPHERLIFVNVNDAAALASVPPAKTIVLRLATVTPDAVKQAKQRGFGVCVPMPQTIDKNFIPYWGNEDHLWLVPSSSDLQTLARAVQKLPGHIIVGDVQSKEMRYYAREIGAQLLCGEWYLTAEANGANGASSAHNTMLELMNLVRAEAPIAQIESVLKRDPALAFKLLRYINSAGFGLSCEVKSFRHAVTILGYKNLARWLTLLLATAGTSDLAPAMLREAVVRGRFTELLGADLFEHDDRDNLFIVGVFSLLPPILQMPMKRLLEQVSLPGDINDALLRREGPYGPLLRLAMTLEDPSAQDVDTLAQQLQLPAVEVNRRHAEAIVWSHRLIAQ